MLTRRQLLKAGAIGGASQLLPAGLRLPGILGPSTDSEGQRGSRRR